MKDPYLYPNTQTLKNLFDEKDDEKLRIIEAEYTSFRLRELLDKPIEGNFDAEHLFAVHRHIFQGLYEWAGMQRIINIEKPEEALSGLSVEYSDVFDINRELQSVLHKMNSTDWNKIDAGKLPALFAELMAELWKIHPFREGNTRTVITFCCDFAEKRGFPLNRELFKNHSAYLRRALVAAAAVFKDLGDKRKPEYLINFIRDAIETNNKPGGLNGTHK